MADHKDEYTEHISATPSPPARIDRQRRSVRFKHHCMRFWLLYALLGAVIILVGALLFVFVIFPRVAQSAVDASTINITSMALRNPTPDSFDLDLVSVLGSKSAFHPQLDAFNASIYLPGSSTPIMSIEIPAVKAHDGAVTTITGQHVAITDIEGFTKYTSAVLAMETVTFQLLGRTGLKQGSFPKTVVNYNKTVTMAGFNSLANFAVLSLKILLKPESDGTNFLSEVLIPNPTVQTIQLGNLAMLLSVATNTSNATNTTNTTNTTSAPIGNARLSNVTLVPGNNTLPLRAITNQIFVFGLVESNPSYLKGLPVDIAIQNSTIDGISMPYFTKALQANPLHVSLNLSASA